MFKVCMKNYYKNLRYVFTVLGVMYLALLIGACFFFKKIGADITAMAQQISEVTANTDFSIFGVTGGFETVLENYGNYLESVLLDLFNGFAGIIAAICIFILIQLIGVYISNLVVFLFGRRDIKKDGILKICAEQLCRSVAICLVWAIIILTMTMIDATVGMILLAFYPLLYCFVALLSAWLTAGKGQRPRWADYVTFKNMLLLLASNLMQILATSLAAVIGFCIFDWLVALVIAAAFVVLTTATTNLNAYAFLYRPTDVRNNLLNTSVTGPGPSVF